MEFVQNFPLFAILLYLSGGVICTVLKPKGAKWYTLFLNTLIAGMMTLLLLFTLRTGESYVYIMGHFSAPWGNEIRIGTLEAFLAASFCAVTVLTLMGGMEHIFEDVEAGKSNLYFSIVNLLMSSMLALIFTNDLFTAYVFVEINTIASCALVMLRYRSGKTLVATAHYLIMSLLGSGLFLIGISMLYDLTGHLLMENIAEGVQLLFATGNYTFPLTVIIGLFGIGMAVKSALWPFSFWLPGAHGNATASSSAILSGLVLKGYIILLVKIFYRVIGLNVIAENHITNVLFLFGAAAMIIGSLHAVRERDLKRMLAFSSVAQIGYVYLGIGIGTHAGMVAACAQIFIHAITKTMLFCSAGGFMSVSGGSKKMEDLKGAGFRDPLGGIAFGVGALSMIGIPLFSGFITKIYLATAAIEVMSSRSYVGAVAVIAIVISTLLNAMYYIPALLNLFTIRKDGKFKDCRAKYHWEYVTALVAFIILNLGCGLFSDKIIVLIEKGLSMFA